MFSRLFAAMWTPVFWPLIQEARDRQRRRRANAAQVAALAAILGLAILAGRNGGGGSSSLGFAPAVTPAEAAIQTSVTGVIADYNGALARGDYAAACGMVDPWMGMTTIRTATSAVGIEGSCEERLAGFARRVGPGLIAALDHSSLSGFQRGGSESRGFDAAAQIHVPDEIVSKVHWWPSVGVAKAGPHARVLITCPPLLCTWRFLNVYSELARSRSARS
jgi:hypothetical protein